MPSATISIWKRRPPAAPQAGVPGSAGYGTIQQGFLETSNVNSVDEITVADHRPARL